MANNTVTYWDIVESLGWRWMLQTQRFTTVSNTVFTTKGNCKRSFRRYMLRHNLWYQDIDYKTKIATHDGFMV